MARSLPLLVALALLGCVPENSPVMNPGQDCMTCHCTGDAACTASALPWTAAGTVFADYHSQATDGVQGVHVLITDAMGKKLELVTNEAGNFYTAEPIAYYFDDGGPGVSINIFYNGQDAGMAFPPAPPDRDPIPVFAAPDQVYAPGVLGKGIGCNGCHQATDTQACTGTNDYCFAPPVPPPGQTPFGAIVLPGVDPLFDPDAGG